mgnify:CR=1 FL=1
MSWLFGSKSKDAEEKIILEKVQTERFGLKFFVEHLVSKPRVLSDPNYHKISDKFNRRVSDILMDIQKHNLKSKDLPLHVYMLNGHFLIHGDESLARLRALRTKFGESDKIKLKIIVNK